MPWMFSPLSGPWAKGVSVHAQGLGVMTQVADMERQRIAERTAAGRLVARESLTRTGLIHRGKENLGRSAKADAGEMAQW